MKFYLLICILVGSWSVGSCQNELPVVQNKKKGDLYLYWGWNNGWFSKSDIHFKGDDYDFKVKAVVATDRQSPFSFDTYLHPTKFSIPQYNFRIGYFINDHWDISIGADHMKYVIVPNQIVEINGEIRNSETSYDGDYTGENIALKKGFLEYEHTDGLNYFNLEVRRSGQLLGWKKVTVNYTGGFGGGFIRPKTNAALLKKDRYDDFNIAGYGINGVVGLNATIWKHLFIQTELKGGFINMPNIRTTQFLEDSASQSFWFGQLNVVFGGRIRLGRRD